MYQNPYTPGYNVLSKSGYNIDSHGSLSNTSSYLITNDFPDYAAMFYSPTEHETLTSIKYGIFDNDYSNLKEIQKSLNGPEIEFYIPQSFVSSDGIGRNDEFQIVPEVDNKKLIDRVNNEALKEIAQAQSQVTGRKIKRVEFEDVLIIRRRKSTIVFEDK